MSYALCNCSDGAFNTGQPNCVDVMDRAKYLIFVQTRKNDGTLNTIPAGTTFDQTYLDGRVNADADERWYIFPILKNYTAERADPITEDIDSISYPVAEGTKTVSGELIGKLGAPVMKKIVDSFNCGSYSYFIVSQANQLAGYQPDSQTDLLPIPIEPGTMWSKFMEATKTTQSRVMQNFSVREDVNDGDLKYIPASDITADLANPQVMAEIQLDVTSPQTLPTEVEVTLTYEYFGTFGNPQPLEGISLVADFTVVNQTTSLPITPSGVVENSPGVYVLTIPAQTTSDVIAVTLNKDYFESNTDTVVSL